MGIRRFNRPTIAVPAVAVNRRLTFRPEPHTLAGMQDMMGGVFGYEPPHAQAGGPVALEESEAFALLNSGRAALEVLLRNLPFRPRCVWVPLFICDTATEPIRRLGLPLRRYRCDNQLLPRLPDERTEDDVLLLVNYFGLADERLDAAAARHPGPVLVDATTALYATRPDAASGIFYSFRKFLPVADGGSALARYPLHTLPDETDDSRERMRFLHLRAEHGALAAAAAAQAAEDSLSCPAKRISPQTRALLGGLDIDRAGERRCANYRVLHAALAPLNRLELPEAPPSAPMCYPFVSAIPDLRDSLIDAGIALPLYWPEVIEATKAHEQENRLARTLLPLPLDQRYNEADMERLLKLILS